MDSSTAAFVSTEILSIFVCFILLYANHRVARMYLYTPRGKIYSSMLHTLILSLVVDCVSWITDGNANAVIVIRISSFLSTVLSLLLLALFTMYLGAYLYEKQQRRSRLVWATLISGGIFILITFVLWFTGSLFVIENGYYFDGPLYPVYFALNIISILMNLLIVFKNRKVLGRHDSKVSYIYMLLPLAAIVLSSAFLDCSYAYQSSTLAILIVYVFMQSEQNHRLENEKDVSEYYAAHDDLTKLKNRRAYSDRCDQLAALEDNLGLIFCDVNGLKYQNDHFGHKAGDKLLTDFADLLRSSFPEGEIYRISGDEFIVFMVGNEKSLFDSTTAAFARKLNQGDSEVACIGSEYGSCRKVEELSQMAETIMYKNKEAYHRLHPELLR